jgi:hypothetical protein
LLALKCKGGLVVISTLPTSPHLNTTMNTTLFLANETTSTTPILDLAPCGLVAATAGNAVDGQVLRQKIQAYAEYTMESQKKSIQASELARSIADHLQVNTQTVGGRGGSMLAVRVSS